MKNILFLCTGNSCRSQMAEALINHDCHSEWQSFSAGTLPAGYVHPVALEVLREIGIEHYGRSKSVQEFYGQVFDQVITVCSESEANCPIWLGHGKKTHIAFPDPAKFTGSQSEVLDQFRAVRDAIRQEVEGYLNSLTGEK